MLSIGQFSNQRPALAFTDYLNSIGIEAKVVESNDKYELIIRDAARAVDAERELKNFLTNPNDPKYRSASWQSGETVKLKSHQPGVAWHKFIERAGPVTIAVSLIAIAISVFTGFGTNDYVNWFTFDGSAIASGEIYRIITPIFLHFPVFGIFFVHLAFNLMWFWDLGGTLEKRCGGGFLLNRIMVIGLFSNIAEYLVLLRGQIFGGLSGVVFGLLGYLWLRGRIDARFGLALNPSIMAFMMVWLVLGFSGVLGSVANAAHLVGLLAGLGIAWVDVKVLKTK